MVQMKAAPRHQSTRTFLHLRRFPCCLNEEQTLGGPADEQRDAEPVVASGRLGLEKVIFPFFRSNHTANVTTKGPTFPPKLDAKEARERKNAEIPDWGVFSAAEDCKQSHNGTALGGIFGNWACWNAIM